MFVAKNSRQIGSLRVWVGNCQNQAMTNKPTSPELAGELGKTANSSLEVDGLSLSDAMLRDEIRLRKTRKRLAPDKFRTALAKSVAVRQRREQASIAIEYPTDLPITAHREELIPLIRDHQVVIVCGETGSGKSTQLPKICLEAGFGRRAMIGHTQPRRLAARSIATRLAEELQTPLGQAVGYQVRFGDYTSEDTLVKLMTDGILLAETQADRSLLRYDAIIIDEAHERSLNIDFLLGYLARLRHERPELRIVITSATIDADRFAQHFGNNGVATPIVNVEGRSFPVETRYLPWEDWPGSERNYDLAQHVVKGIESLGNMRGDALVFLPTERDIREVSHQVEGHFRRLGQSGRFDLLPLYARLPSAEQQRIFHPTGNKIRLIFATNVAESSLTVPGIRYVIDSGTARMSRYSARSKLQRLPIEPVSQASANQRAGRCGRVGPGVCVRLFSLADFESRDAFTTPEIRRTNLASAVLQMKTLGLGSLENFPLLDPPRPELIREGVRTLIELGAIDERHELTPLGRRLGRLPVDPRVGRILLAAEEHGVLPEILPIAAALEIQDPRDRPPLQRQAADQSHAMFADPRSDFLSYLRLWRFHETAKVEQSRNQLTRVLKKTFLSPARMREWFDVYRQLKQMMAGSEQSNSKTKTIPSIRYSDDATVLVDDDRYASIHISLLTGLLFGVALRGDKTEYTGTGGLKLYLWPGSGVIETKPKWIVAAELVETTRQYARTVAQIQPQWIELVASHIVKRSYSDPHWSEKSGAAFCYEQQTLFGLPVVTRRRTPLSPIDPNTSRDLLIERGLVEGELNTNAIFVTHNRRLCELIAGLAAKTRRRDWVVDPYTVQQLYQARLPEEVCDRVRMEKYDRDLTVPGWTRQLKDDAAVAQWLAEPPPHDNEATIYFRPDDLLQIDSPRLSPADFPDELEIGASRLPLEYKFEPGADSDGVNLKIHQAGLSQISDDRLGWLVPGLLHTKIVGMIKSLPKRIRRNLVPASDVAQRIVDELMPSYGQVPFMLTVCQAISRHAEMLVTAEDFQSEKLEPHLQFHVTVVNDAGQTIATGREVEPLRKQLGVTAAAVVQAADDPRDEDWQRDAMMVFDIERLPKEVVRQRGGVHVALYPGLVDNGNAVATAVFADVETADASTRKALVRLFALREKRELRSQVRWLPSLAQARIKLSAAVSTKNIEQDLSDLIARLAFIEGQPTVRGRAEFEQRCTGGNERIGAATQQVEPWLASFSDAVFAAQRELESTARGRHDAAVADVREQISRLFFDEFWSLVPWQWLQHYPRYFRAIGYRLEKLRSGAAPRDGESLGLVSQLWSRFTEKQPDLSGNSQAAAAAEFRWMMEELRVSLFAQPLGTAVKVSPQRCEKML